MTSLPIRRQLPWQPQPAAAAIVGRLVERATRQSSPVRDLAAAMRHHTGTRLIDWIDHIAVRVGDPEIDSLADAGFKPREEQGGTVWRHPDGLFPPIVVRDVANFELAIKVESIEAFLAANAWCELQGDVADSGRRLRVVPISHRNGVRLSIVERHGLEGFIDDESPPEQIAAARRHQAEFAARHREFPDAAAGFRATRAMIDDAIRDLGVSWACDRFFATERDYWMSRNRAARVQRARQDELGLGWANHDHHTYRSSREAFASLIEFFEALGFECRERFYAGQEAGWGAQVLEHSQAGIVIFADVDLAPEEVVDDFAHEPLRPRQELGTIGLWCKLHGESLFEAGMHHLECQFDFDAARAQLAAAGVHSMAPFTDFPHLRQAFTQGEMWVVDPDRLSAAIADGSIGAHEADRFREGGAVGSHLEILERNDGYKGFNQTGISDIIQRTDPRSGV